jgi:hypothetical protein
VYSYPISGPRHLQLNRIPVQTFCHKSRDFSLALETLFSADSVRKSLAITLYAF